MMKNCSIAPKNKGIIVLTLVLVFAWSPHARADETAPGVGAKAPYGFTETIDGSLHEIDKTGKENLLNACSGCKYDENHKFSCPPGYRTPHHLDRCEVIVWSNNAGSRSQYRNCGKYFVGSDGHLSEAGQAVMAAMEQTVRDDGESPTSGFVRDNNCMSQQSVNDLGMKDICPNFNGFDPLKKMEFWEYVFENIAYREVSCSDHPRSVRGTTSATVCEFQLEANSKIRKGRGIEACDGSVSDINNCSKCAVGIMHHALDVSLTDGDDTTCAPFGHFAHGDLFKMYWQSLNPPRPGQPDVNRKFLDDLHWFPGCQDNPQPWPEEPKPPPHAKKKRTAPTPHAQKKGTAPTKGSAPRKKINKNSLH